MTVSSAPAIKSIPFDEPPVSPAPVFGSVIVGVLVADGAVVADAVGPVVGVCTTPAVRLYQSQTTSSPAAAVKLMLPFAAELS